MYVLVVGQQACNVYVITLPTKLRKVVGEKKNATADRYEYLPNSNASKNFTTFD